MKERMAPNSTCTHRLNPSRLGKLSSGPPSRCILNFGELQDAPLTRAIEPPEMGRVIELSQVEDFTADTNYGQLEPSLSFL